MKYLLRLTIIPIVYIFFIDFISLGLDSLDTIGETAKIIINAVCLGFYGYVVFRIMQKEGEEAGSFLIKNNFTRREMLRTGKVVDINTSKEYRWWKGFATGLLCLVPLFVCLVWHLIVRTPDKNTPASIVAQLIYVLFYRFLGSYQDSTPLTIFYGLPIAILGMEVITGVPYILGAYKRRKQQEKIKELERELHGE